MKYALYSLLTLFTAIIFATRVNASLNTPQSGNLSMPVSQQPGAFVSLGQNILDKGDTQVSTFPFYIRGQQQFYSEIDTIYVHGITDDLSLFIDVPVQPRSEIAHQHISAMSDTIVQLEKTVYEKTSLDCLDQGTFLTNVTIPTGNGLSTPNTGLYSPSMLFGGTFLRTCSKWLAFTSGGTVITTSRNGLRYGNLLLYQFGLGRNVYTKEGQMIIVTMAELTGSYAWKNRIDGQLDPNSGGQLIFLTPSILLSTQHIIVNAGIGFPVYQQLNGQQYRYNYQIAAEFTYTLS